MKQITAVMTMITLVMTSCGNSGDKKLTAFIPGVYVTAITQEFASGMDSLIVSPLDKEAGTYTITKNAGYTRKLDGKELGYEHKTKQYTVVYEKEHKQLIDRQKGDVFTVVLEKNLLLHGSTEYRKVNIE